MLEIIIFAATAAVAIASAAMVVFQRNAMFSALFLVANFFCLAVLFLLLGAYFLAVVQIAVYAGAIMVLMLFVIMLLNVAHPEPVDRRFAGLKAFGVLVALVLLGEVALVVFKAGGDLLNAAPTAATDAAAAAAAPHTSSLAAMLFTRDLFPFEVTYILLLAAILGAVVIARKRQDVRLTQAGGSDVLPSLAPDGSAGAPSPPDAAPEPTQSEGVPASRT